jgi:predicted MFS family arabinose efflux permease
MRRILGLSPAEFGLIAMLWGLGALTGSFVCARYNHLVGRGTVVGASAMAFGAAALVFSLSREPAITAPANFALGFAMTATMTSSVIVVQHLVADEVRGRVMGLFPLVMGASMLNVLLIGALGQEFGLPVVVTTASATALAGAALILAWNRPFRAANASGPDARPAGAPGPPPLVPAPEDGG